jgi:CBS domain containing-hemolysin-like protein
MYTKVARPALALLNGMANGCLRLIGVQPQDELAQAHGPQELRLLIASSGEHGTLDPPQHDLLTSMLAIADTRVAQVMTPSDRIVAVPASATARQIECASRSAGRSRLAVRDSDGAVVGIVHLRDAARVTTAGHDSIAAELMTTPFTLTHGTPVAAAVRAMREHRAQLAVVVEPAGHTVGLVALEDLLEELIGEFDDETDRIPAAARTASETSVTGKPAQ